MLLAIGICYQVGVLHWQRDVSRRVEQNKKLIVRAYMNTLFVVKGLFRRRCWDIWVSVWRKNEIGLMLRTMYKNQV